MHTDRHMQGYEGYVVQAGLDLYVAKDRLELTLLSLPSQCWDNRQGSLVYVLQGIESRALCIPGKHFCQRSYIPGQDVDTLKHSFDTFPLDLSQVLFPMQIIIWQG